MLLNQLEYSYMLSRLDADRRVCDVIVYRPHPQQQSSSFAKATSRSDYSLHFGPRQHDLPDLTTSGNRQLYALYRSPAQLNPVFATVSREIVKALPLEDSAASISTQLPFSDSRKDPGSRLYTTCQYCSINNYTLLPFPQPHPWQNIQLRNHQKHHTTGAPLRLTCTACPLESCHTLACTARFKLVNTQFNCSEPTALQMKSAQQERERGGGEKTGPSTTKAHVRQVSVSCEGSPGKAVKPSYSTSQPPIVARQDSRVTFASEFQSQEASLRPKKSSSTADSGFQEACEAKFDTGSSKYLRSSNDEDRESMPYPPPLRTPSKRRISERDPTITFTSGSIPGPFAAEPDLIQVAFSPATIVSPARSRLSIGSLSSSQPYQESKAEKSSSLRFGMSKLVSQIGELLTTEEPSAKAFRQFQKMEFERKGVLPGDPNAAMKLNVSSGKIPSAAEGSPPRRTPSKKKKKGAKGRS